MQNECVSSLLLQTMFLFWNLVDSLDRINTRRIKFSKLRKGLILLSEKDKFLNFSPILFTYNYTKWVLINYLEFFKLKN